MVGPAAGVLGFMRHAPQSFDSGIALIHDVAAAKIVAQVKHRIAPETFNCVRLLFHLEQRWPGNIRAVRVRAIVHAHDGGPPVSDERPIIQASNLWLVSLTLNLAGDLRSNHETSWHLSR